MINTLEKMVKKNLLKTIRSNYILNIRVRFLWIIHWVWNLQALKKQSTKKTVGIFVRFLVLYFVDLLTICLTWILHHVSYKYLFIVNVPSTHTWMPQMNSTSPSQPIQWLCTQGQRTRLLESRWQCRWWHFEYRSEAQSGWLRPEMLQPPQPHIPWTL